MQKDMVVESIISMALQGRGETFKTLEASSFPRRVAPAVKDKRKSLQLERHSVIVSACMAAV